MYTYICMYICVYVCKYMYTHTHTHTHILCVTDPVSFFFFSMGKGDFYYSRLRVGPGPGWSSSFPKSQNV